jgi:hypothetical protein
MPYKDREKALANARARYAGLSPEQRRSRRESRRYANLSEAEREKARARSRTYYREKVAGEQHVSNCLKTLYGITLADKRAMAAEQGHRCKICSSEFVDLRAAHVDHDHTHDRPLGSGLKRRKSRCDASAVRGLLCFSCNTGLGSFKDNIALLERAVAYLLAFTSGVR